MCSSDLETETERRRMAAAAPHAAAREVTSSRAGERRFGRLGGDEMLGASSGRDATRAAVGSGGEGRERRRTADGRQRNPRYARVAGREKKREEK